ncbi:MAG: amidase [Actinomycetota bacterium]
MTDDLATLDASGHAELIASGALSPVEAVDAALERIERVDPQLNAVIHLDADAARAAAARIEPGSAPFAGVPFLVKDIGATQAGLPYWSGNRALQAMDHRLGDDTELGARFRRAGLVTLGKTNLPELGSSPTTQPLSNGPTNNPWDPTRSPAGSSGGSAAAVAAGLVPMAHANDGGGSTRLPAAWCGLVGLKTTRGRVPNPDTVSRLISELVVTTTVRDTAGLLDAVQGSTPADLYQLPSPERPYRDEVGRDVEPLRIAVLVADGAHQVDAECSSAARSAGELLAQMGHDVSEVGDDVLLGGESSVNGRLWMAGLTRRVQHLGQMAGRPLTEDEVEPYNWAAAQRGGAMTAAEWVEAEEDQQAWVRKVFAWLAPYDVLVTPTAGCPALTTEELTPPADTPWKISKTYARIGLFTLPFNVTGHPAISLPLYESGAGLPIGVQFVGGFGREDRLIRLAAHLEQALPWAGRRPMVHAAA